MISRSAWERLRKWFPRTAGTGDIAPIEFEIGGKHYQLELRRSDKLGKLKDNEFLICQGSFRAT